MLFNNLDAPTLIARVIVLIVAFSFHEFAHAWTADQLGDDTPRFNGRLTLNPMAHLDPMGSLMLLLAGFGWAKPVPINIYAVNRRTPAGYMLVSLAGPLSNLILAIFGALPIRMGLVNGQPFLVNFFLEFIFINLILMFFNLIPLYPLDGEKVVHYFLPPEGQAALERFRPTAPLVLLGLIVLGSLGGINILGTLIGQPARFVLNLLVF
ncbi:MAG: site-2 protease family protein [Anaerolineales bacterium]|jgi:Zn-dependent protease